MTTIAASRAFYTRGDSFSSKASREHIEQALHAYGATAIRFSNEGAAMALAFAAGDRQFRIVLAVPEPALGPHGRTGSGAAAGPDLATKRQERLARKFWHAFSLAVDAKLAAVAEGVATLESEFLAHVLLPGNRTVLEELTPLIDNAYRSTHRDSGATGRGYSQATPSLSPSKPER